MSKDRQYYIYNRPEMIDFIPGQYTRVLEIGCGEGNFRANLDEDCEYWGIEPFEAAAKVAANKLFKVINKTYDEAFDELPDNYYDLVVCNDVIEHMTDYVFLFRTIKKKMKPSSFIIGSIPNVRYIKNLTELLIKKDWKYKDEGILDKTHYRFF
ncbi:MAG: class I SAM-dependent methyltransferase, partial [Deltaproteobacteria bacterium]|nr:class I SAM-dependent methyltransferase [Deltaproteobacteria bacterium]